MDEIRDPAFVLADWQRDFIDRFLVAPPGMDIVVADVGMGKTTVALHVAKKMLSDRTMDGVLLFAESDALRSFWRDRAARARVPMNTVVDGKTSIKALGSLDVGKRWLILDVKSELERHSRETAAGERLLRPSEATDGLLTELREILDATANRDDGFFENTDDESEEER
jgi:hypothetical protein